MTTRPPAEIGMPLDEVDTPALLLDLDAFERNLRRLPTALRGHGRAAAAARQDAINARVIALTQIALRRRRRVRARKSARPRRWSYGGVPDVLIANEVVGAPEVAPAGRARAHRADRRLRRRPGNIAALDAAAARGRHATLDGACRDQRRRATAAASSRAQPRGRLARAHRATTRNLRFAGLQAYHGSAQHLRTLEERRRRSPAPPTRLGHPRRCSSATGIAVRHRHRRRHRHLPVRGRRAASTPSCNAGSYIFMDADYGRNLDRDGQRDPRVRARASSSGPRS